ncbi:hypothetical protein [Methanosarcina spelaei]|nr:hypothetical protein [Methanosarcina spelaei]
MTIPNGEFNLAVVTIGPCFRECMIVRVLTYYIKEKSVSTTV